MAWTTTYEVVVVTDDKPDPDMSDDALWHEQMLGEGSIMSVAVTGVHELPPPDEEIELINVMTTELMGVDDDGTLVERPVDE